jgi:DtxR family Mn-dependent transcriptional regulator
MVTTATDELTSQGEDYLEAIYHLRAERGLARARDIARRLGVHKSTVTGALHSLAEKGLVQYAPYEAAGLTREGERRARDVIRRHEAIGRFLSEVLLLDAERSQENACRIEHAIGPKLLERLLKFVGFVEESPRFRAAWLTKMGVPCTCREKGKPCRHCAARRKVSHE